MRRAHWEASTLVTNEWQVEKDILAYLARKGILAWPTHGPRNRPTVPGVPDIIGIAPGGRMIAIEVKAEDGIVSEAQEAFHRALYRNGCRVLVARSLDDVIAAGV